MTNVWEFSGESLENGPLAEKWQDRKSKRTKVKNKTGDKTGESNDGPEIPDRGAWGNCQTHKADTWWLHLTPGMLKAKNPVSNLKDLIVISKDSEQKYVLEVIKNKSNLEWTLR